MVKTNQNLPLKRCAPQRHYGVPHNVISMCPTSKLWFRKHRSMARESFSRHAAI